MRVLEEGWKYGEYHKTYDISDRLESRVRTHPLFRVTGVDAHSHLGHLAQNAGLKWEP